MTIYDHNQNSIFFSYSVSNLNVVTILVNFLIAVQLTSVISQISINSKTIILKLFVLSGTLACNANENHFVLRKGNNSNKKCQKRIILESSR